MPGTASEPILIITPIWKDHWRVRGMGVVYFLSYDSAQRPTPMKSRDLGPE